MKRIPFIFTFLLVSCFGVAAQTANCPKITITGPPGVTSAGDKATFTAKVDSALPTEKLEYDWTVSLGSIIGGQGTAAIEVLTKSDVAYTLIKAIVKIKGFPEGCPDTAFEEAGVNRITDYFPVARFGKISRNDARVRMMNLYIRLDNVPESEGVIVVRFNKKDTRRAKILYLNNLIYGIVSLKKDPARVSFEISEGDSETNTTIHWVKPGEDASYFEVDESKLTKGEDLKTKMKTLFLKR